MNVVYHLTKDTEIVIVTVIVIYKVISKYTCFNVDDIIRISLFNWA